MANSYLLRIKENIMSISSKVLASITGNIGVIQLNNTEALHALNVDMIRSINDILISFTSTGSSLRGIIMSSSPHPHRKVFCAGGDVKAVYLAGMGLNENVIDMEAFQFNHHGYGRKGLSTADFFREEYQMNYKIAALSKDQPLISLWDGLVFGGGVGVSIHGRYRVCTENTLFGMPETGIGFFPDVRSSYFLTRLQGGVGLYLALTGATLKASDLIYTGLATHYIPSEKIHDFVEDLSKLSTTDNGTSNTGFIDDVLGIYHIDIPTHDCFLAKNKLQIDSLFYGPKSVEDIYSCLKGKHHDIFARDTLNTLGKMSPTSLKVTMEAMVRGCKYNDIRESLKMEYRLSQACMRQRSDFYEGIRATLIDKDKSPKWKPPNLEAVTESMVSNYFESLGDYELIFDDAADTSKL